MNPRLTVIIPARNEKDNLNRLLPALLEMDEVKQVIVADGQSEATQRPDALPGVRVLTTEKGRARQMNRAAEEATGDVLWFLHADSVPDSDSGRAIGKAIDQGYAGGCFSLYFYDYDTPLLRYIARNSNRRAKHLRLMFGDQGIFVTRSLFTQVGGYPVQDLMEDWELSLAMFRNGKVKVLDTPIGTSARRFIDGGTLRTLLYMHSLKIRYVLGASPEKLARNYREHKR